MSKFLASVVIVAFLAAATYGVYRVDAYASQRGTTFNNELVIVVVDKGIFAIVVGFGLIVLRWLFDSGLKSQQAAFDQRLKEHEVIVKRLDDKRHAALTEIGTLLARFKYLLEIFDPAEPATAESQLEQTPLWQAESNMETVIWPHVLYLKNNELEKLVKLRNAILVSLTLELDDWEEKANQEFANSSTRDLDVASKVKEFYNHVLVEKYGAEIDEILNGFRAELMPDD